MTVFYLVRHAHARWTPDENRPLSERGQADALRLDKLLSEQPIAAIYASTARRAQQTVAPLAERLGLALQITPALDERRLCEGEAEDFEAAVRATWADFGFAHPGGETNAEAQARGLALVYDLAARRPDAQIVLGTHGNLLALIVQGALMVEGVLPASGYAFWQSLTMPDLYRLDMPDPSRDPTRAPNLERLWVPLKSG